MSGVGTMMWKELREAFVGGGRPVGTLVGLGFLALLFGIGMPLVVSMGFDSDHRMAFALTVSGLLGVVGAFLGFIGPLATVVDSFAGERERHTLETLLATPLSDRAIVGGKVLAQFVPVWITVGVASVACTVTSTVLAGLPGLLVLPLGLGASLLGGTVTATFIIGLGSLISLRAPTVKKGQEWIGYAMMPVFFPLFFIGPLIAVLKPDDPRSTILIGLVATFAVPALIILLGILFMVLLLTRFRRDRLIGR